MHSREDVPLFASATGCQLGSSQVKDSCCSTEQRFVRNAWLSDQGAR